MKPWRLWWICPVLIFCGILFPGLARADGYLSAAEQAYVQIYGYKICAIVDANPTDAGVSALWEAVHRDGWEYEQAADIINRSVHDLCPVWWTTLQQIGRRQSHEMAV